MSHLSDQYDALAIAISAWIDYRFPTVQQALVPSIASCDEPLSSSGADIRLSILMTADGIIALDELTKAVEELQSCQNEQLPEQARKLLCVGYTLLAHHYVSRRRTMDELEKAQLYAEAALARDLQKLQPLVTLSRIRLSANALFRQRKYREASERVVKGLQLMHLMMRDVFGTFDASISGETLRNHPAVRYLLCEKCVACFNASLCARYASSYDEALEWLNASFGCCSALRATSLGGVQLSRLRCGRTLLQSVVDVRSASDLVVKLVALESCVEGVPEISSGLFASILGISQALVERFLAWRTLHYLELNNRDSLQSPGGVKGLILRLTGPKKPSADSLSAFSDEEVRGAAIAAANEIVSALSTGRASEDVTLWVDAGLPIWTNDLPCAKKHAFVTILDFAITSCKSGALATYREWSAGGRDAQYSEMFPSFLSPMLQKLGCMDASEAASSQDALTEKVVAEYANEEDYVLFNFNPFLNELSDLVPAPTVPAPAPPARPSEFEGQEWQRLDEHGDDESSKEPTASFIPHVSGYSRVECLLRLEQRVALNRVLPTYVQNYPWKALYISREHGSNFRVMYERVANVSPLLLAIRESNGGYVFGAFLTSTMEVNNRQTSMGESFLWTFGLGGGPSEEDYEPIVFPWTERNTMFMECRADHLTIGGGGEGPAIYLGNWLKDGMSNACDTFGSPPLCPVDTCNGFTTFGVEVYSIGG